MSRIAQALGITAMTLALSPAVHAQAEMSRAQVVAEQEAAARSGDLIWGDQGLTMREKNPARYAEAPSSMMARAAHAAARQAPQADQAAPAPEISRTEVKHELAVAKAEGELGWGNRDESPREEFPNRYPASVAQ